MAHALKLLPRGRLVLLCIMLILMGIPTFGVGTVAGVAILAASMTAKSAPIHLWRNVLAATGCAVVITFFVIAASVVAAYVGFAVLLCVLIPAIIFLATPNEVKPESSRAFKPIAAIAAIVSAYTVYAVVHSTMVATPHGHARVYALVLSILLLYSLIAAFSAWCLWRGNSPIYGNSSASEN